MYSGELRATFNLSHGDFGNIYAFATLSSGFILIWLGKIIDRVDLRLYGVCLCLSLASACLLLSAAQGVITLVLSIFFLRLIGQGLFSQAATVTMARYFDDVSRGKAVSLAALGFPCGQAIFPFASVLVLTLVTWREVWVTSAVFLLVTAPFSLLWLLKGHKQRHLKFLSRDVSDNKSSDKHVKKQWTRSEVLRDSRFFLSMTALMSSAFILTGLNFHQVHLTDVKGWDLGFYASCFSIYAVCQVAMSIVVGVLVDRFGAVSLTPFYLLPMVCSTLVIAFCDASWTIALFMALAGTTGGATATILSTMWAELYGVLHLGSIKAMVAGIQVISSALGPAVFGLLIDVGIRIEDISLICGTYAFLGCILLAVLFRPNILVFRKSS